jgi:flagellar motor switch protein FliG
MVSETSSTYENIPQSEIDQAQRVIVRELRNLLKTGKVDIKNIIEG